MKIKIKKWEELNWKYNEKYVLFYVNSEYKYGNGIRIREKTVGSEVCFIRLFSIDQHIAIKILNSFGFDVEFAEPIKLTKKQYNFVRSVDEGYFTRIMERLRFNIEKRNGADAQSWMHFDEIIDFPFIQEGEEWSIESLRDLECAEAATKHDKEPAPDLRCTFDE